MGDNNFNQKFIMVSVENGKNKKNKKVKAFKILSVAFKTYYCSSSQGTPLGEGAECSHNHYT